MLIYNSFEELSACRDARYAAKHAQESNMRLSNRVVLEHYRHGNLLAIDASKNTMTTTGMARVLNIVFCDTSKTASKVCYTGLFKANITPVVGDTAAKLGAGNAYDECQDAHYNSPLTNRPLYNTASTSSASITNSGNKSHFVMAAAITVYGAFVVDAQAKTATTGVLYCANRFGTPRDVIAADELYVTYQINMTTT